MDLKEFAQTNAPREDGAGFQKVDIGPTSGESIQMEFTGSDGFIDIQPNEEGSVTQS